MQKHTPKPWRLGLDELGVDLRGHVPIHSKYHAGLAQVVWVMQDDAKNGKSSPTCQANARLIAAAPDQNDALIGLLELVEELDCLSASNDSRAIAARAAIAKATGEQV